MELEYPIDVYALRRKVFNHTVAKTYLGLQEIAQLKTYDEGYQRKRDIEHENKIIEYLKNSSNRYLPDIIVAIRHHDMNFGDSKAKEIDWWMYVFKKSNDRLNDIFSEYITDKQTLQNSIVSSCDY